MPTNDRAFLPCAARACPGELAYRLDDTEPDCLGCTVCGRRETPADVRRLDALLAWHYGGDEARRAPGRVVEECGRCGEAPCACPECRCCRRPDECDCVIMSIPVALLSDDRGTVWGTGEGCITHKTEVG